MSFVPAPQQANAASAKNNAANAVTSTQAAAAATETPVSDQELLFKIRTFDVFWVDKKVCPSTVTRFTVDNGVTLLLWAVALQYSGPSVLGASHGQGCVMFPVSLTFVCPLSFSSGAHVQGWHCKGTSRPDAF
jgi:hypothetical protein